jgi:hypothetical protein
LYGTENTTNTILNFLSNASTKMDVCADSNRYNSLDKDLFIQKPIANEDLVAELNKILNYK